MITTEGGTLAAEYLNEYAADRVQTFGTAFLGLSFNCCRCHDHKFDPVTQDELRSMTTEQINHGPGITFMQTGHQIPGRPAIGAWLSYGLGSANHDLPSFVVMFSQGRGQMQALFSHLWGAGLLPGEHQRVPS